MSDDFRNTQLLLNSLAAMREGENQQIKTDAISDLIQAQQGIFWTRRGAGEPKPGDVLQMSGVTLFLFGMESNEAVRILRACADDLERNGYG